MRKQLLLREDEKTTLMNDAAVSTISFYSGTTDAAWLRTRVRDMVRCNPVLGGNLVTGPEGPQVDYDDTSKVGTGFFTMVEGPVAAELVPTTAYDQLAGFSRFSCVCDAHKYEHENKHKHIYEYMNTYIHMHMYLYTISHIYQNYIIYIMHVCI